jgi:hypothetical protein
MEGSSMRLADAIGFRWFERRRQGFELRMSWAEITGGLGLAAGLINWGEDRDWSLHLHIGWPNIYLKLPFIARRPRDEDGMMDKWGFSVCSDTWAAVHLNWGAHTKIVHLPWDWTFYRHSILAQDGRSWITDLDNLRSRRDTPPIGSPAQVDWFRFADLPHWSKEFPYRYVMRSGEVQERVATISVEEREWRWRWFAWLPFPRRVQRSIDVRFSDEVGERTGSWKGGCVGCGYTLLPDETPEECLRRMELERKF